MIRACFPGNSTIRCGLYELELNVLTGRHTCIQKPVRIVRRQHWTDGAVPRGTPVSKFNCIAREKDVVAYLCGCGVVDGESYRDQFGGEYCVLNAVGNLSGRVGDRNAVIAVGDCRRRSHNFSWRP